jgi:hypothetical protein
LARSRKTKRPAGFRRRTHNPIVVSLVERGGDIRSTMLDHRSVMGIVRKNVHHESRLVTDQAQHYKFAPVDFRQNTRAKLGINDEQRTAIAVRSARGKRLTYETTHRAEEA